jgi:DNA polymerase-1
VRNANRRDKAVDAKGDAVAQLVDDCLQEAARRWAPDGAVRFVADIAVLRRWSDAKG